MASSSDAGSDLGEYNRAFLAGIRGITTGSPDAIPVLIDKTCAVPGTRATIQAAVNDPACATINLSAQTYAGSLNIERSLTLSGPGGGGAVVEGLVLVVGAGTAVNLNDLAVENGCAAPALQSVAGAEVTGNNLTVERSAALACAPLQIFQDGFESADTSAWSQTVP